MGDDGKPRGGRFVKGDPRAGRKKGQKNKVTQSAREWCLELLARAKYRDNFLKAWDERALPPQLEIMVHHYAYGKPKETHEVTGLEGGPIEAVTRVEVVLVKASGKAKD